MQDAESREALLRAVQTLRHQESPKSGSDFNEHTKLLCATALVNVDC